MTDATAAREDIAAENMGAMKLASTDEMSQVPVPAHLDTKAVLDYLTQLANHLGAMTNSVQQQISSVIEAGSNMNSQEGETNEQTNDK
jgi:hypothetical protein